MTAVDVAKLFLLWANRDGDVVTNLKMQKLLYYAQAWHLVHFSKPLFAEKVEAWNYGPVIHSAYKAFSKYKAGPIEYSDKKGEEEKIFSKPQLKFLKEVYKVFIGYSAHALVNMSHNEMPWKAAFAKGPSAAITHEDMRNFY